VKFEDVSWAWIRQKKARRKEVRNPPRDIFAKYKTNSQKL